LSSAIVEREVELSNWVILVEQPFHFQELVDQRDDVVASFVALVFHVDKRIECVFVGASCLIRYTKARNVDGGEVVGVSNLIGSKEGERHVLAVVSSEAEYKMLAEANRLEWKKVWTVHKRFPNRL